MSANLADRFERHVLDNALIPPRARVLVAVSGGLDSVVALNLLRSRFPDNTYAVAHFDHGWRDDSAADAEWVHARAREAGLEVMVERAAGSTSHTENDARKLRYSFLRRMAREWKADFVVTAHHADDQAETVLFRLARGAGTRGLCGIPVRNGRLIRPLLPFRRSDLESYARAAGLEWREDISNRDARFARNRIRHLLMPALERDAPGVTDRMLEISRLAAEAEEHWKTEVRAALDEAVISRQENGFTLARGVLLGYHPAVRARVIRHFCEALGAPCSRSGTRLAAEFIGTGQSGTAVEIARGVTLTREFDILMVRHAAEMAAMPDVSVPIPMEESGCAEAVIGGRRIRVRWSMDACADSMSERDSASFAPASLRFPLELRGWQPGDQIRMSYGSKKLKKLFVERRIERSRRPTVPVLVESGTGSVLWMPGIARAAKAVPVSGAPVFRSGSRNDERGRRPGPNGSAGVPQDCIYRAGYRRARGRDGPRDYGGVSAG